LQRAKNRIQGDTRRRARDINHKVSRTVVDWAAERQAGTILIGDVRAVADGVDKGAKTNQKLSQWSHGQLRQYITYKAASLGMEVVLQPEHYTSQTCPCCGNRRKQNGRVYKCGICGWSGSRDGQVGAANLLSNHLYGELARVRVKSCKYRHPFLTGKRSPVDTRHVANSE
jgi:putative transposase